MLLFISITISAFTTYNDKISELIKAGNRIFATENYYEASLYYKKALEIDKHHPEAHYQLAECYRNLFDYKNAMYHYQKVQDTNKYPLATYYLGQMQRLNGLYKESSQTFHQFIQAAEEINFKESQQYIELARNEQAGNQFVLEKTLIPKGDFHFYRLNMPINSPSNDYGASVFINDTSIVLSSARAGTKGRAYDQKYGEFYSDNFFFTKGDSIWEDKTIPYGFYSLNTAANEGAGVFNAEKNKYYFTICYQGNPCYLYVSELIDGKWSKPTMLPESVNKPGYDHKQPALSVNEDTLYFSSDRPGGYGQHDLWMSIKNEQGEWTNPLNLGKKINTTQNEVAPFFYTEDKLLFFSSNGHPGYGGFDNFFVSNLDTSQPINLGYSFNSSKDDLYLHLGTHKGYLTSNRDNPDGNFDVYSFNLLTRQAVIFSLQDKKQRSEMSMYLDILRFFGEKDQQFFEELPLEDKQKVQLYIERQSLLEALSDNSAVPEDLLFMYEELSTEEKSRIDRLILAKKKFLLKEDEDVIAHEDYYYYEKLPLEKKEKISQLIEAKMFQSILIDQSQADEQLVQYFEELPLKEKESIQRTIQARKEFLAKNFQDNADLEDVFLYQTLSAEEKDKLDRSSTNLYLYEMLPAEEKKHLTRTMIARQFFNHALNDSSSFSLSSEQNSFDIGSLAIGNPQNITIQGTLTRNQKPAGSVNVIMESEDSKKEVVTDAEGKFEFSNIEYQKHQKILFDSRISNFIEIAQYTLEELTITVLQDTIIEETFDNIYFEKNKHIIPDSAKAVMDKLASFHFKHPDVQITIVAFADSTGTDIYNITLSKKRAQEVNEYLIQKGVNPASIFQEPMGEEKLEDEDLQYSRRIEFDIKGISSSYNPTREIYIIQPNPNLEKISQKYGIPLSTLIELNSEKTIEPFTPIKIVERLKK